VLNGLSGDDSLSGRGGSDLLFGGLGEDQLAGGEGNDVLRGDLGADDLFGGDGVDTATYVESTTGVNVNLTTGLGFFGTAQGDQLSEIENLNGSQFKDTLVGNDLRNVLNGLGNNDLLKGLAGSDLLNGGFGDDTLVGGEGNDTLNGNEDDDSLVGDSGKDFLNGNIGNDWLLGGLGPDTLTGGGGFDRFVYHSLNESLPGFLSRDIITDFNRVLAGDVIDVSAIDANLVAAGDQPFTFIGSAAFSAPGQLRYSGGLLQGTVRLDLEPQFEVQLADAPPLTRFDIAL
jgi:Ca2+-binding RTX toxin-like protein